MLFVREVEVVGFREHEEDVAERVDAKGREDRDEKVGDKGFGAEGVEFAEAARGGGSSRSVSSRLATSTSSRESMRTTRSSRRVMGTNLPSEEPRSSPTTVGRVGPAAYGISNIRSSARWRRRGRLLMRKTSSLVPSSIPSALRTYSSIHSALPASSSSSQPEATAVASIAYFPPPQDRPFASLIPMLQALCGRSIAISTSLRRRGSRR